MKSKNWVLATEDGEYIVYAEVFASLKGDTLRIRVNEQVVVQRADWLVLRGKPDVYTLPIPRHNVVVQVINALAGPHTISLVADGKEIPPGQRVAIDKIGRTSAPAQAAHQRQSISALEEELKKLENLKQSGLIDEAEYKAMRGKLLGGA